MTRAVDERGSGLVTGLVLIFAFTFLGIVWLARDVDRSVSNRTAAQSIAFQAARSGAQQLSVATLRDGSAPTIEYGPARSAATRTANQLFGSYGVAGRLGRIAIEGDQITVTVSITDEGRTVTGISTVRAERAP